jgi:hypothetical protein
MAMMTPEEYTRYNAFKAVSEVGKPLDVAAFRAVRKAKFRPWLPPILAPYQSICDYGSGSGWLRELCEESGKTCIEVDDIGGGTRFADIAPVDLIVSICVLEHMTPEQVTQFFDTAKVKGRALFLVTNNPKCLFSHLVLWDDITHVRLYSEHSIGALLQAKGFTISKIFYQDDVLTGYGVIGERLAEYQRVTAALGPMFLGSPYNYWCMLATPPLQ